MTVSKSPMSRAWVGMMLAETLQPGESVVTDDEEAGQDKEGGECCLLSYAGVSVATCP